MRRLLCLVVFALSLTPAFAADFYYPDPLVFGETKRDRQYIYQQQQMEQMRRQQEDFERQRRLEEQYRMNELIRQRQQQEEMIRMMEQQEQRRMRGW